MLKKSLALFLVAPLTLCANHELTHDEVEDALFYQIEGDLYDCFPECNENYFDREQGYCPPPPCAPSGLIFVFGDFLYWQAKEGGLDYVVAAPSDSPQPPYAPDTFPSALDDHSHYNAGYRAALGYCRDWDTLVCWTRFHTTPKSLTTVTNQTSPLVPLFLNTASGPEITSLTGGYARGCWDLRFDVLDWEIGYAIPYGCLDFRPHVALRAAWIRQQMDLFYNNVTFVTDSATNPADYSSLNKNDFKGLGLRIGGDGNWNIWRCFSLFATSGFSLLSGTFDISRREVLESTVVYPATTGTTYSPGTERATTLATRHQLASALDLSCGLALSRQVGKLHVTLSAGWEGQIWFAQNQMLEIVDASQNFRYVNLKGNLTLQGLTARIGAAF